MRCRHAFETACVHANGDVVCSIIDGRGDYVLGNVHQQSLAEIFRGPAYRELRDLVLSTTDTYCRAIGKHCPLKTTPVDEHPIAVGGIRFLQIEPTTACDLRCLSCPVRDFDRSIGWRDAYTDGGAAFMAWDSRRRLKQHFADLVRPWLSPRVVSGAHGRSPVIAQLLRGRISKGRTGRLPLETIERVLSEAGPLVERVDFYNYGEPFLYPGLVPALRCARSIMPATTLAISTDGMQVKPAIEDRIIGERLLDWWIFSIDGCDPDTYARYRIRGDFGVAIENLTRVARKASRSGIHIVWQYVVFHWNDRDEHFRRAAELASRIGVPIWFDFARSTWGRSRRRSSGLEYLRPFLKPETDLPTWN